MRLRRHMWPLWLASAVMSASIVAAPMMLTANAAESSDGAAGIRIGKIDTSKYPDVQVAFTLDQETTDIPAGLSVVENGTEVSNLNAFRGRLGISEPAPKTELIIMLDASLSMQGEKFAQAQAAAKQMIAQATEDDLIGLVTFGDEAQVVVEPTKDHEDVIAAVDAIKLTQGTALNDAVGTGTKAFSDGADRRIVVLLSDGVDTGSTATLDEALTDAKDAKAEIYSVGIVGRDFEDDALIKMSTATGGTFDKVANARELSALYAKLGSELLRGYWLQYRSATGSDKLVKIELSATGFGESQSSYKAPLIELGSKVITPSAPDTFKVSGGFLPIGTVGRIIAALPFALMLAMITWSLMSRSGQINLAARVAPYTAERQQVHSVGKDESRRSLFAPLFAVTESLLGKSGTFRRYRALLERANVPLREVELLWMGIAAGAVGFLIGALMFGPLWALLVGFIVSRIPKFIIKRKAKKRLKKFDGQLADVLNTVSSSLRAGHSFLQAINTVVKETENPTAEEFQRVLGEARLGLSIEDAMAGMAQRMGSKDFEFVVTTINIQRSVGGSLAEILEMVGDTVRGRQQFNRKVKALTSQGRMSAYVLLGMPFGLAGVLTLMSRDYMMPLFVTRQGHMMILGTMFFMTLGYLACMKIVNFKT